MAPEDSSTRSWDAVADDWVAHADANDYRLYYLMPRMLAFVADVRGTKILDLGCGEGGYASRIPVSPRQCPRGCATKQAP